MTLWRAATNLSALALCGLLAPCVAFAVDAPSGVPLEHVDTALLGAGQQAAPPAAPGWAIQVGAFADEAMAEAQLTRISERVPDGLSRAVPRVASFAWDKDHMFYRVRFGGLDASRAQAACAFLNRHGENCFVVADEAPKPVRANLVEIAAAPAFLPPPRRDADQLAQVLPSAPVIETAPVVEALPVVEKSPVVEKAPVVVKAPFVEKAAVAEKLPVVERVRIATNSSPILGSAAKVNNTELSNMRGGFFTAAGAQFDFGASIRTLVNGQLALQTNVQWTPAGQMIQQLSGLGASIDAQVASDLAKAGIGTTAANLATNAVSNATAATSNGLAAAAPAVTAPATEAPVSLAPVSPATAAGLSGVQIAGVTGGSTQVFANVGAGQIQNIILNSASNQTISQNTNVTLTIYNFPAWQQQILQNAVSSQLAHDILAASGLSGH